MPCRSGYCFIIGAHDDTAGMLLRRFQGCAYRPCDQWLSQKGADVLSWQSFAATARRDQVERTHQTVACSLRVSWMARMASSTLFCSSRVIVTLLGRLIPVRDKPVLTSKRWPGRMYLTYGGISCSG